MEGEVPILNLPAPAISLPRFPPPPSRKCTIIQAKPCAEISNDESKKSKVSKQNIVKGSKVTKLSPKPVSPLDQAAILDTKEQRRMARKIAHSDIERRRRTKINHQFDELKELIPACKQFKSSSGGDAGLHKLVILQHAVEYIRHLKSCIESVESTTEQQRQMSQQTQQLQPSSSSTPNTPSYFIKPSPPHFHNLSSPPISLLEPI